MAKNSIWLTWETQRRNKELAEAFDSAYGHFDFSRHTSILRYALSIVATVKLLVNKRPQIVFAQCPSVVLCVLAAFLKFFFRYTLVIDAHNIAVDKTLPKFTQTLIRYAFKRSDLVIVSNSFLCEATITLGGKPMPPS